MIFDFTLIDFTCVIARISTTDLRRVPRFMYNCAHSGRKRRFGLERVYYKYGIGSTQDTSAFCICEWRSYLATTVVGGAPAVVLRLDTPTPTRKRRHTQTNKQSWLRRRAVVARHAPVSLKVHSKVHEVERTGIFTKCTLCRTDASGVP